MAATGPTLSTADLARVAARTLVMAGDDDAVAAEHTLQLYRGIPDAELAVVPGNLSRAHHREIRPLQPHHPRFPHRGPRGHLHADPESVTAGRLAGFIDLTALFDPGVQVRDQEPAECAHTRQVRPSHG